MFPLLFALIAAMLFGLLAHGYYGTADVISHQWIDIVFWSLIGTGVGISTINAFKACLPCQVSKVFRAARLQSWLCRRAPC